MNRIAPYQLETERLLMRCWAPADARALREAIDRSDEHLRPWIPFMRDEPRTLHDTARWLGTLRAHFDLGEHFRYAVWRQVDEVLVGENMLLRRLGPHAFEIGYLTHVDYGGRGYAQEATCAMIKVGFECLEATRLEIHVAPENELSAAIPERLGFQHEATLARRMNDTDGEDRDLMIWTLFAEDYPGSPAQASQVRGWDALEERIL